MKSGKLIVCSMIILCAVAVLASAAVQAFKVKEALRNERLKTAQLSGELQKSRESVYQLSRQLEEMRLNNGSQRDSQQNDVTLATDHVAAQDASQATASPSSPVQVKLREGGTVWRAKQEVSEVENLMALDSAEKDKLLTEIRDRLEQGLVADSELIKSVMLETLGVEKTSRFEELKQAAQEKELVAKVQRDVIVVSRKLNLSPDQEKKIASVIESIERQQLAKRSVLNNKMREAMSLHFEDQDSKDLLKIRYDEITAISESLKKEKQELVFESAKDFLNDQQKNALLELQALE